MAISAGFKPGGVYFLKVEVISRQTRKNLREIILISTLGTTPKSLRDCRLHGTV